MINRVQSNTCLTDMHSNDMLQSNSCLRSVLIDDWRLLIMSLAGKVALVVGGGRGIGAATVRLLVEQGATVAFSYVQNTAAAEALAQTIRANGMKVEFWQADAHDAEQVKALVQRTRDLAGHLDIVINCVPPQGLIKPFATFTWEEFILGVDSELKTAYELAQAAIPLMRDQHAGRLVFVTSAWAKYPNMDCLTSLSPAFAAQVGFVKALAKEIGRDGITVNTVAPGMVDTNLSTQMPPEVRQQVSAITPLGRIASPEDIAQVITFLASDMSGFMTGTYIPVSGGLMMD
jgi:3-oxoacyl-[acyl-carrier protein] reductase